MKPIASKPQIVDRLIYALTQCETVDTLIEKIREAFLLAYAEMPLLVSYEINLVETESLRYSEFYESSVDISFYAIQISGLNDSEYIWRDCGEWVLADAFYTPESIAEALCKASLFNQSPESVRDLLFLLNQGYWQFVPQALPIFEGEKPDDALEILSWDERFLLIGTTRENVDVVSRDEWKNIVAREVSWI